MSYAAMCSRVLWIALAAVFVMLSGCVSVPLPTSATMQPPSDSFTGKTRPGKMFVKTQREDLTSTDGRLVIPSTEFRSALIAAIKERKLIDVSDSEVDADYVLRVNMVDLRGRMPAINMRAELECLWVLQSAATKDVILRRSVRTEHTGESAFAGAQRMGFAVAGAVRKNIDQGLRLVNEAEGF